MTAKNQYTTVDCFKGMSNYVSSEIMKSDISLYTKTNIPLFLSEVHSGGPYICDVDKCLISLVFQLRVLRQCCNGISQVQGFVFPNFKSKKMVSGYSSDCLLGESQVSFKV